MTTLHSHRVKVSPAMQLHLLEQPGPGLPLLLLHGLTANCHSMDGLFQAGLPGRVLAADLRGRGQSDKPCQGYSLADHAGDIVGLLDALELPKVVLGGHSFGALVSMFVAAHYPQRVEKLVLLDISHQVPHSQEVFDMVQPSVQRLGRTWSDAEAYVTAMKKAPIFAGWWEPAIEGYLRADLETLSDGQVRSRVPAHAIEEVLEKMRREDWVAITQALSQPTLLFQADGPFPDIPLVTREMAEDTLSRLPQGRLVEVPGNHITMLYGAGARRMADEIGRFL